MICSVQSSDSHLADHSEVAAGEISEDSIEAELRTEQESNVDDEDLETMFARLRRQKQDLEEMKEKEAEIETTEWVYDKSSVRLEFFTSFVEI